MKTQKNRRTGRGMKARAAAVTAGTLAMVLGASVAASAEGGSPALTTVKDAQSHTAAPGVSTFSTNAAQDDKIWSFGIDGRDSSGRIWSYPPKANGFGSRTQTGYGMGSANAFFKNNSGNDTHVNVYARFGGTLRIFSAASPDEGTVIGTGWNVYNAFVTPGNVGGAANPDLLARDSSGVLWLYLSYADGTFAKKRKVGGGWNTYNQIAGRGDLTGDGKPDIVARDSSGALWLYKGTGNIDAPFAARTKIGGGWNTYNKILSLGDTSGDGRNDLIARDTSGVLWLYKGTGNAGAPFAARVKIGGGWNTYNYLF
ncbi:MULTISPECIES: FG-GAP-like repeat-containing protein [unclassified Streptomyces]|uniref:FG-GAP repeat domain-containing protein n=2 Tax=unclassified Streptomyces TaxID=2593676 RepID=UPI0036E51A9F